LSGTAAVAKTGRKGDRPALGCVDSQKRATRGTAIGKQTKKHRRIASLAAFIRLRLSLTIPASESPSHYLWAPNYVSEKAGRY
jgi:hypothetical protein